MIHQHPDTYLDKRSHSFCKIRSPMITFVIAGLLILLPLFCVPWKSASNFERKKTFLFKEDDLRTESP